MSVPLDQIEDIASRLTPLLEKDNFFKLTYKREVDDKDGTKGLVLHYETDKESPLTLNTKDKLYLKLSLTGHGEIILNIVKNQHITRECHTPFLVAQPERLDGLCNTMYKNILYNIRCVRQSEEAKMNDAYNFLTQTMRNISNDQSSNADPAISTIVDTPEEEGILRATLRVQADLSETRETCLSDSSLDEPFAFRNAPTYRDNDRTMSEYEQRRLAEEYRIDVEPAVCTRYYPMHRVAWNPALPSDEVMPQVPPLPTVNNSDNVLNEEDDSVWACNDVNVYRYEKYRDVMTAYLSNRVAHLIEKHETTHWEEDETCSTTNEESQ